MSLSMLVTDRRVACDLFLMLHRPSRALVPSLNQALRPQLGVCVREWGPLRDPDDNGPSDLVISGSEFNRFDGLAVLPC